MSMESLSEIQAAIAQLSSQDVQKLAGWLRSYLEIMQDIEIEDDIREGRTDRLMQRARHEIHTHHDHE